MMKLQLSSKSEVDFSENKDVLQRLKVFSELTSKELEKILAIFKPVSLKKNDVVFQEGDTTGALYVVVEGSVRISSSVQDDLEKPLATIRAGGVFGEVSLIDRNPREAHAICLEASKLLVLENHNFEELLRDEPQIGTKILKVLTRSVVERIRNTNEEYRRKIQWGLSVSGALKLNWHRLITDETEIQMELMNGKQLAGIFVKVEENPSGYEVFVQSRDDKIHIVPYHAVQSVSFKRFDTRDPQNSSDD